MEENEKVRKRSLIRKYFDANFHLELMKITMIADADNNDKNVLIRQLLDKTGVPYDGLGAGTNRYAVLIDGYAVKFALDEAGRIDNKREFLYTKKLQPYVVKIYECDPDGSIAVSEFVEIFNMDDFNTRRGEMIDILNDISSNFLIGDVGITSKNYVNWGKRNDDSICILDFAYIYSVSYKTFNCKKCDDGSILVYDNNFVNLICPSCGSKSDFREIRRRITREQQKEEIGDIKKIGYCVTKDYGLLDMVKEFEPVKESKEKKKELSEIELLIKKHKEEKELVDDNDYWS